MKNIKTQNLPSHQSEAQNGTPSDSSEDLPQDQPNNLAAEDPVIASSPSTSEDLSVYRSCEAVQLMIGSTWTKRKIFLPKKKQKMGQYLVFDTILTMSQKEKQFFNERSKGVLKVESVNEEEGDSVSDSGRGNEESSKSECPA